MRTGTKIASIAFTGATAAAALGAATHPALATGLLTVIPGGHYTTANLNNPVIVDNETHATLTCTAARGSGTITTIGTTLPAQLGTVSDAHFGSVSTPCSLGGAPLVFKLKKPTAFVGTSYTNGVLKGHLGDGTASDISVSANGVGSVSCHGTAVGRSIPASFIVASNTMNINKGHDPTLTVKSGSCAGLINVGDSVYFSALFAPTPGQTVTYGS